MHCRLCGASLDTDRAETLLQLDIAWWDLCGPCAKAEHGPAVNAANHSPDAFTRHLRAAHGYLELGHVAQARDHLPKPAFLPKPSDGILRGLLHGAWA